MSEQVVYVYGIVPARLDVSSAPRGIDESPVALDAEPAGEVAALSSELDSREYARERVEARVGELSWLAPRATAHDAVLTWASAAGAVIPLPMFTLFTSRRAVCDMLRSRGAELAETLRQVAPGEEYAVRVFRLHGALAEHLGELSPRVRELERAAAASTPGQRYLLERKLEGERSSEARRVAGDVAREVYRALAECALQAASEPPPRQLAEESVEGIAVLNGFFLVPRGEVGVFRRRLEELSSRHEPQGFRFEVTGPWPPYHFARARE